MPGGVSHPPDGPRSSIPPPASPCSPPPCTSPPSRSRFSSCSISTSCPGQHLVCHPCALASCRRLCVSLGSGRAQPKGRGHPLAATRQVLVEWVWLQVLASAEVALALPAVPQTSTLVLANWCPAGCDCVPGDHGLTFRILRFRTGFSP